MAGNRSAAPVSLKRRSDSSSSGGSSGYCGANNHSGSSCGGSTYDSDDDDVVTLYVRAGFDNKKYGACPFCQRVFMVLMVKAAGGPLKFKVATVPKTGLPEELRQHGIRNLPALLHRGEALDSVEEMVDYIEAEFPMPRLAEDSAEAEAVTRNFFSKFCYYIKSVSKDAAALDAELRRMDQHLRRRQRLGEDDDSAESSNLSFLDGGSALSHLDCEIMPKLHHLRVAGHGLKRLDIPAGYAGVWRYLHSAYDSAAFVRACPPDAEIVLHWADRVDVNGRGALTGRERGKLTGGLGGGGEKERFSFDVPALAVPITLA